MKRALFGISYHGSKEKYSRWGSFRAILFPSSPPSNLKIYPSKRRLYTCPQMLNVSLALYKRAPSFFFLWRRLFSASSPVAVLSFGGVTATTETYQVTPGSRPTFYCRGHEKPGPFLKAILCKAVEIHSVIKSSLVNANLQFPGKSWGICGDRHRGNGPRDEG